MCVCVFYCKVYVEETILDGLLRGIHVFRLFLYCQRISCV